MNEIFCPSYNFYQLSPAIYLIEMDNNDDLAYTFLRVQEFYESINSNFRGHSFTLEEYKEWYCTQSEYGTFSYGEDWAGFNVPSHIIRKCYQVTTGRTEYDIFFLRICENIQSLARINGSEEYYLCGVRKGDTEAIEHEMAHGLFTTNKEYKEVMLCEIEKIDPVIISSLCTFLSEAGYSEEVHLDEIQAHLSTGLINIPETDELLKLSNKFNKIFKMFLTDCGAPRLLIKGLID